MRRATAWLPGLVTISTILFALLLGSAWANNFGFNGSGAWYAEDRDHQFFYGDSIGPEWENAADFTRIYRLNPTAINTTQWSVHDGKDVHFMVGAYDVWWIGLTNCDIPGYSGECLHFHVRMDTTDSGHMDTLAEKRHLTCHEFGHSVGLHHYPDDNPDPGSCMKESWIGWYSNHDEYHINQWYG
jgi:hypothetical protein